MYTEIDDIQKKQDLDDLNVDAYEFTKTIKNQNYSYSFRKISDSVVFLRSIVGFLGGLVSTIIIVIVYMLGQDIIMPLFTNINVSYIYLVFLMLILFLITIPTNILVCLLLIYSDRDKYFLEYSYHLKKIFFINLFIFFTFVFIYFLTYSSYPNYILTVLIFNIIFSIMLSSFTLDAIGGSKYVLNAIFGLILGIFLSFILNAMFFAIKPELVIFFGIPITWGAFTFSSVIMEVLAFMLYQAYGIDFFRIKQFE